jgi:hypothetical protein
MGLDRQLTSLSTDLPVGQSTDQQVTPEVAQYTALLRSTAFFVMAGLVPAIHVFFSEERK